MKADDTINRLWLLPLALFWPALQLLIFILRFGTLPPGGLGEALVFLPMGLVAGIVLIFMLELASTRRQRRAAFIGYAVAAPLAFMGSLLSGLILSPIPGTLLFGAGPLIAGTLIGYALGRMKAGDG